MDNKELIAEARGIGNWAQHETGPEGEGKTGPTLFARLVYALGDVERERDAALAVIDEVRAIGARLDRETEGSEDVSYSWREAFDAHYEIDDILGKATK